MRRSFTIVGLAIVLLALLALAVVLYITPGRTKRAIAERQAGFRAQGFPTDRAELDAWYPAMPAAENGAAFIEAAVALEPDPVETDWDESLPLNQDCVPKSCANPLPLSGPLPLSMEEAMAAELDRHADALPLYRAGGLLKRGRYSASYSTPREQNPDAIFGGSNLVKRGAWYLALETTLQIEHRQTDRAVEGVEAVFGIGETIAEEPMFDAQLRRMQIHVRYALPVLARLLSRATLSEAQLARLADVLRAAETRDCLYRGVAGLRCRHALGPANPGNRSKDVLATMVGPLGLVEQDLLWSLDRLTVCVEVAQAPADERFELTRQAELAAHDFPWYGFLINRQEHKPMFDPSSPLAFLSNLDDPEDSPGGAWYGLGGYSAVQIALMLLTESVEHAAELRCARTALAVERYRRANGKLPERLDDLVPAFLDAVPLDPFTHGPLRYKRDDAGYVVYGLGADREDDGGVAPEYAPTHRGHPRLWDDAFRIEHETRGQAA